MKRLLVDIDGVVADLVNGLFGKLNNRLGTNYKKSQVITYSFTDKDSGVFENQAHADAAKAIMREPEFTRELPLEPGAINALTTLSQYYEIVWTTTPYDSSPTWCYDRTRWIGHHLGKISKSLVYTAEKHLVRGDILIDDKPQNIIDFVEARPENSAILFDQPWNRDDESLDKYSLVGWPAILKRLMEEI